MEHIGIRSGLAAALLSGLLAASPAAAQVIGRVSVGPGGAQAVGGESGLPAISADGRFVAFASEATNLVPGDTNGKPDVFVHDRASGITTRVSVASAGTEATGGVEGSIFPGLSADGRFVVFNSDMANLVPGDTNGFFDVFVHDRNTGATTRVSVATGGGEALGGEGLGRSITADGRFVVFGSDATNLGGGCTGAGHVYVHDRATVTTTCVSGAAGGGSHDAAITPDGRFVVFHRSGERRAGVRSGGGGIFVHDRADGSTLQLPIAGDVLSISADGRFVAFAAAGGADVPGCNVGPRTVRLHDRQSGTTVDVDSNADTPAISADGRFVAYLSFPNQVRVFDASNGTTTLVSQTAAGVPPNGSEFCGDAFPAISADGRFVAFPSDATNLVPGDTNGLADVFLAVTSAVPAVSAVSAGIGGAQANGQSGNPTVSADGRFVAFGSVATNLVAGGCTSGSRQIYVRDRQTGVSTCVSVDATGAPGDGTSSLPALSADGRFVAFESTATNLAAPCSGGSQVYVHDRATRTTTCVSVGGAGAGNGASGRPAISGDGRLVAFQSAAGNLASPCGGAGGMQVFVRDRSAGTTTCVSTAGGAAGNGASANPSLSGDGRFVAYDSAAGNLVSAGCTTGVRQIFVHDRVSQTTTCESVAAGGAPGTGTSEAPRLNADGTRLAFQSAATNLASPCTTGTVQVFVRDRSAGVTRCASVKGGSPGNAPSVSAALSGNGRRVAFASSATNLAGTGAAPIARTAGGHQGAVPDQIFDADLGEPGSFESGTVEADLVSESAGGELGSSSSTNPAVNSDGSVVAFQSAAANLTSGDTNGTEDVFAVEAATNRATFTAPAQGANFPLTAPTPVTFAWTALAGATQYGLEFTGPNRQFANPNDAAPDPVNGFGGAGGAVLVPGTRIDAVLLPDIPPGSYQLRVIALSASGQPIGVFSDALTLTLGPLGRPTITVPASGSSVGRGSPVTVSWTAVPGAVQYGLEFTGPNRQFANPNAALPDPVNGFGGAGGALLVGGITLSGPVPPTVPPGAYELRVIALSGAGVLATFSDAVTLVIE